MRKVGWPLPTFVLFLLAVGTFLLFGDACGCGGAPAKKAACLSNLKQLALGFNMYANDYDDVTPGPKWTTQLVPYVHSLDILKDVEPKDMQFGYAMNATVVKVNLADMISPEKRVAFFDSTVNKRDAVSGLGTLPNPGRHDGWNNASYADGHAKSLPPK